MLVSFLFRIKDHHRKQGRRYHLGHILLFAILAILSGADSYRKIHAFIETHYATLDKLFGLNWKRMPAYTTTSFKDYPVASSSSVFVNTVPNWRPTLRAKGW